jgi:hypothetical protein
MSTEQLLIEENLVMSVEQLLIKAKLVLRNKKI